MKMVGMFFLGVAAGLAVGWLIFSGPYRYKYQVTEPLVLVGEGRELGVLPRESLLLADVRLERVPDVGWWGFVPVLFNDMMEAQDLGIIPWSGEGEIWEQITLRAWRPLEEGETSPRSGAKNKFPDPESGSP